MKTDTAIRQQKTPMRRCVGCMESKPKQSLIRIAGYQGQIMLDPVGKAKGRGVYLCPDTACFQTARKKRALQRGLHMEITPEELDRMFKELATHAK